MLSYQHGYHAGNLADVHKHALLASALDYLTRKEKPLSYIETHAGRGLYDLVGSEARKTGEAAGGIVRAEALFDPAHPYVACLGRIRTAEGAHAYPGSPRLAADLLRSGDRMTLAELHPAEYAALAGNMAGTSARILNSDGLALALADAPPTPRRGLLLCDPSYEVKGDYDAIARWLPKLHRIWNVGVLMLWYPVLHDARHRPMVAALRAAHTDALIHEVAFAPPRSDHRLRGSGMVVVNPPWGLHDETRRLDELFAKLSGTR